VNAGEPQTQHDPEFDRLAAAVRRKQAREIAKLEKLIENLHGDLRRHGDADTWKKYGDLLLANVATATREGDSYFVSDYFEAGAPQIAIPIEDAKTPQEAAEIYFRRYTKSRNAAQTVAERLKLTEEKLTAARERLRIVDEAIANRDVEFLTAAAETKQQIKPGRAKKKNEPEVKGVRRFASSDGYEILVGKKAADNDFLTFRIARSRDIWMHAADYPGSHVVVRRRNKEEIPHRTLVEAAQLAAFYSDARGLGKAAVRYTEKKFVNKPKRSPAGRVSVSEFKTLLVEPAVAAGVEQVTRP
jgi:predicted ribosome quality control (RQC) complex YloA/Tae2 family protein